MKSRTSCRSAIASGGNSTGSKRNVGTAMALLLPVRVEPGEAVRDPTDVKQQVALQFHWHTRRKMQIDGIRDAAEALFDCAGDLAIGSAGSEDAHHVVRHFVRHRVPTPFHRHAM